MKTHIAPTTAGHSHELFLSFDQALKKARPDNSLLLGGFAYATLGGVEEFVSHAETSASWVPVRKKFVIGIHHGITEPSALRMLGELQRSEVRLFIPGHRLTSQALVATPVFHPKMLALTNANTGKLRFLQAGSANLTHSAMSDAPRNHEFSIALRAEGQNSLDSASMFRSWWSRLWDQSRVADRRLIDRYAKVRLEMLEENPILRRTVGPPSSIGEAEYFFIEVGAASGPPGYRHQVEFPESLSAFFGDPVRHNRKLILSSKGDQWPSRPLSYKVTTYGVEIWRLGMPTQNSGGEPIAGRAIRFRRTTSPDVFEFAITDMLSRDFAEWESVANSTGHIGATHGQRPRLYGYY